MSVMTLSATNATNVTEVAESWNGLLTAIIHNTMVFAVDYSYNYEMFDTLAILDTLKPKNLRAKR